jgi:hypothetical protein
MGRYDDYLLRHTFKALNMSLEELAEDDAAMERFHSVFCANSGLAWTRQEVYNALKEALKKPERKQVLNIVKLKMKS